ncbi:MAG: PspA/IM30 family protein [Synechococcales bacterium]|nr:PspA/IM30 family protein [Synechococcales bacterium]
MKQFILWFMGDRAGRVMLAVWNWLWGKPIEQGGKIAVEVAQESLYAMQQSVHKLTESVAKAIAAYERANQQYQQKKNEAKRAESQALQAQQQGYEDAARLAIARAIEIERILPRFASQVEQAKIAVQQLKNKLIQERQKLESYQVQMQTLKALSEVNEALASITNISGELNLESARNQFQEAQTAIENRHFSTNAMQELSQESGEQLQYNLDRISLDSEIEQRLKQLQMN